MVATFCGQLVGTAAGNHLYANHGWVVSGSYSVASIGAALLCCAARGPWETHWLGWRGGWDPRKRAPTTETALHAAKQEAPETTDDLERGRQREQINEKTDAKDNVELLAAEEGENPLREIRDREGEHGNSADGEEKITAVTTRSE